MVRGWGWWVGISMSPPEEKEGEGEEEEDGVIGLPRSISSLYLVGDDALPRAEIGGCMSARVLRREPPRVGRNAPIRREGFTGVLLTAAA